MERGKIAGGVVTGGGLVAAAASGMLDGVPTELLTGGGIGAVLVFCLLMVFRGHLVPKGLMTKEQVDELRTNWNVQLADKDKQIATWHEAWKEAVAAGEKDREVREQQAGQIDELLKGFSILERFITSLPRPREGGPRPWE